MERSNRNGSRNRFPGTFMCMPPLATHDSGRRIRNDKENADVDAMA